MSLNPLASHKKLREALILYKYRELMDFKPLAEKQGVNIIFVF